jgi:pimeloyl-ACP methyl ester carboxylesterase
MTSSVDARPVEPKQIEIPGRQFVLTALDYGNEGATPMLLVHGMRDLAWSLDSVAQAFCDRYRVVSLDLRGHGDSGRPGYYALPHFVSDAHATIDHLSMHRPILLGHSFGGEVVSQLAGIFPEIPAACILVEGLGPPPWEGEGSEELRRTLARRSVQSLESIPTHGRSLPDLEAAEARLREAHPRLDEKRASMLTRVGTRPHPEGGICWKWDPMLTTTFGSFSRDQIEERWRWIDCPVLVVTGSESGTWWSRGPSRANGPRMATNAYLPPSELTRRLALFKDVQCVEISGAGHMIHFDAPEALNQTIADFLST